MAACAGTRRDGTPCTTGAPAGQRYCWHHDPARAEERSRNASRAATLKHSRVGQEIRDVREMVKGLVYLTVSNELHPTVKKRLAEIVQLLQVYARLTELELAAGENPPRGDVALPPDTGDRVREWVDDEEERVREKEELTGGLAAVIRAHGGDTSAIEYFAGG